MNDNVMAGSENKLFKLIDKKLNHIFGVIHKPQNTDRAWSYIEEFFHIFATCKGKSGGVYLRRQILGFKWLFSGHHQ